MNENVINNVPSDLYCEAFGEDFQKTDEKCTSLFGFSVSSGKAESENRRGKYITVPCPPIWENHDVATAGNVLSKLLFDLLEEKKTLLAVGLGNSDISCDSLGSRCIERLIVSEHSPHLYAYKSSVPGKTGVDSAFFIETMAKSLGADAVICIDSLAARFQNNLGRVVQLTDGGITPGSGVACHGNKISSTTVGIPVVSVGIPTVFRTEDGEFFTHAQIERLCDNGSKIIAAGIMGYWAMLKAL